ncbi:hypothetical protein ACFXOD_36535 [Streptomyces sp. NPDC059161]|uniref:hypothetical protein n=1 Tax=Streptomyces sp. NPDC059161 TaxID=3346749 RepID=UPI0036913B2F
MPERRLIAAVYVKDPATHEDLILLPGESPAPEIAVLVTNPDAWDAPPCDDAEPEPIAIGEPDPTGGTAGSGQEQGEAGGEGAKKAPSRRARSSSA